MFAKLRNIFRKIFFFHVVASGRVKNVNSLDAAYSVVAVFSILQSEHIFRKKDVIFLQFLFRLTDCQDLYDKCINYALSMKALCFFEATSGKYYFTFILRTMFTQN